MGKKITTEEWVRKAQSIHGNKYDYSNTIYENAQSPVLLYCNACKADFTMLAKHHVNNKSGCRKCASSNNATKKIKVHATQFITKARKIHGDTYDYSEAVYTGAFKKVKIECPVHGYFWQTPDSHVNSKHGCFDCGIISTAKKQRKTFETFLEEARSVHGDKYEYLPSSHKNNRIPMKIICPEHGEFEQSPGNHIRLGQGCPYCAVSGFNTSRPAILYYLKISHDGQTYYKIGITGRSIKERFSIADLAKIEVVFSHTYENGQEAYDKEQVLLSTYRHLRYRGDKILFDGNTEIFTDDIFSIKNADEVEKRWYQTEVEPNIRG